MWASPPLCLQIVVSDFVFLWVFCVCECLPLYVLLVIFFFVCLFFLSFSLFAFICFVILWFVYVYLFDCFLKKKRKKAWRLMGREVGEILEEVKEGKS